MGATAVVIVVIILPLSHADAGCPFFTRPAVESDSLATLNSYEAGSYVCHSETMYLCRTRGEWKNMGPCTSYQRWEENLACKLEGTSGPGCGPGSGQQVQGGIESPANPGGRLGPGEGEASTGGSAGPPGGSSGEGNAAGGEASGFDAGQAATSGSSGASGNTFGGNSPGGSALGGPGSQTGGMSTGPDTSSGPCFQEERIFTQELQTLRARQSMQSSESASMCGIADQVENLARRMQSFYGRCPSSDVTGNMMRWSYEAINWSNEIRRTVCSG